MLDRIIQPFLKQSSKSILILGPRQVGKSTLIETLKPDRKINFADEALYLQYAKDPGLLKRELSILTKPSLIALDEVQRIPAIFNSVQAILDEGKRHRFILTGSSARKLKRGQANLLPGRIIVQYMDPLSFWELDAEFNLEKVLQRGSLPEIYLNEQEGLDILETYTTVYLKEEIQHEAVTKNVGSYARFLDLAAQASGQWINYSKIASDSEIPKETIRRFFTILEETLVAFRIPAYQPSPSKRHVSQRDRFLFFDVGVRNVLLGLHRGALSPIEKGNLFEHWIILQCLCFIRAYRKNWQISTYRTDAGVEVDLILDIGPKLVAIEIKHMKKISARDWRGLKSFESVARKPVKKLIVYTGETAQKFSQTEVVLPFKEFLTQFLPSLG